jgi:protein TonB
MQSGSSIVNLPLLMGIALSLALHAAAFYAKGLHAPAKPAMQTGRTVVQLTLLPTAASKAAAPVQPPAETPAETVVEPLAETQPAQQPEPVLAPAPVPVAEPTPEPALPEAEPETLAETATADAPEQIAALQEEKGVVTEAMPVAGINPSYPRMSQRRGEQGTVVLSIKVLANGTAGNVAVLESSGFRRLDDAAIAAAQKARYIPAKKNGRHVDSELIQPLVFELTQPER